MSPNMGGSTVRGDPTVEEILDTIGDRSARSILAAIGEKPQSAKELANQLDLSLPTVYRRLEVLQEHNLVTTKTLVAEDGNHYDVYESNFNSTVISLEGDEYDIRVFRQNHLPDRFSQLWDDLHHD